MVKAYKYRLYPTPEQKTKIDQTLDACRLVYNLALQIKIWAWQGARKSMSGYELGLQVPPLRAEYPWISEVNSGALYASINRIDKAFKNFNNGRGYPKFKSKRGKQTFQAHNNSRKIDWDKSFLSLPKLPNIPIVLSRRFNGKIKTVTISRTITDKYFASILVETSVELPVPTKSENAVGVDLGINSFAILSTGEKIDNPRYLKTELARLKVLQRRASRKKKGSNNRRKAFRKVALLHEKITNQRNDFLHKLSTRLIRDNQTDTICVENLAIKNMVKNHKLAQAISDVSWAEFIRQLEYKGKWYGKNVIKIDRFYASSKTCSTCGHVLDQLNLSIREWTCSNCGTSHDRDINAAINIRNSGMGSAGEPAEQSALVDATKQELKPSRADELYNCSTNSLKNKP